jgi:hypothetical protein
LSTEEINRIDSCKKVKEKNDTRKEIILQYYPELIGYTCAKISTPTAQYSYKRHITSCLKSIEKNKPDVPDMGKNDKDSNLYMVFIDSIFNRLIIVVWNGKE